VLAADAQPAGAAAALPEALLSMLSGADAGERLRVAAFGVADAPPPHSPLPRSLRELIVDAGAEELDADPPRAPAPAPAPAPVPAPAPTPTPAQRRARLLRPAALAVARAALEQAESVLAGVRRRGAAAGEELDAATEAALWPRVFAEAFARQSVPALRTLAAASRAAAARDDALLASPLDARAQARAGAGAGGGLPLVDDGASLAALCGAGGAGWAAQRGPFAGEEGPAEWAALVREDCARLAAAARDARDARDAGSAGGAAPGLSAEEEAGAASGWADAGGGERVAFRLACWSSFRWLDAGGGGGGEAADAGAGARAGEGSRPDDADAGADAPTAFEALAAEYPALHELASRLHSLPFELNRRVPALRFTRPCPGMLLLRRHRVVAEVGTAAAERAAAAAATEAPAPTSPPAAVAILDIEPAGAAGPGGPARARRAVLAAAAAAGFKLTALYAVEGGAGDGAGDGAGNSADARTRAAPRISLSWSVGGAADGHAPDAPVNPAAFGDSAAAAEGGGGLLLLRSRTLVAAQRAALVLGPQAAAAARRSGCTVERDVFTVSFFLHGRDEGGLGTSGP